MPPLKMHALPPTARAALAAGLAAALACGWIDPAQAQRKAVKWVVTCPAPRAAAKADSAPAAALAMPDPVETLVAGLAPATAAADRLATESTAAPISAALAAAPAGAAAPVTPLALAAKPVQGPEPAPVTAAAAPPGPVFLLATVPRWEVLTSDMTLSKTLARWAQDAGYRLQWDAPRNFLIGAPTGFSGDFESAVSALLSTPGIRLSEYPLEACLYGNSPPLLRITRYGEQARECTAASQGATRTANLP